MKPKIFLKVFCLVFILNLQLSDAEASPEVSLNDQDSQSFYQLLREVPSHVTNISHHQITYQKHIQLECEQTYYQSVVCKISDQLNPQTPTIIYEGTSDGDHPPDEAIHLFQLVPSQFIKKKGYSFFLNVSAKCTEQIFVSHLPMEPNYACTMGKAHALAVN